MISTRFAAVLTALAILSAVPAAATPAYRAVSLGQSLSPDLAVDPNALLYCQKTGGVPEVRTAYYNTNANNPKQWLQLSGQAVFCRYTAKIASNGSIYVSLDTLYTTKPTLAALAYYGKPKIGKNCSKGGQNPASCYCSQLGASDSFGSLVSGNGGWVLLRPASASTVVLDACIFPDLSSIDSFGLAYHAQGIVRGIDLSKVLRYKSPFH